jgi:hypothetical protein
MFKMKLRPSYCGCAKFLKANGKLEQCPRELRITTHWGCPHSPAAGCARGGSFSRVRKVLKSDWEVGAVSPGVADHNTLGIPQYTCLVAAHVVDRSPGVRKVLKSVWQVGAVRRELRITTHWGYPNTPADGGCARGGLFTRPHGHVAEPCKVSTIRRECHHLILPL